MQSEAWIPSFHATFIYFPSFSNFSYFLSSSQLGQTDLSIGPHVRIGRETDCFSQGKKNQIGRSTSCPTAVTTSLCRCFVPRPTPHRQLRAHPSHWHTTCRCCAWLSTLLRQWAARCRSRRRRQGRLRCLQSRATIGGTEQRGGGEATGVVGTTRKWFLLTLVLIFLEPKKNPLI